MTPARAARIALVAAAVVVGYQAALAVAVWRFEVNAADWNQWLEDAVAHDHTRRYRSEAAS